MVALGERQRRAHDRGDHRDGHAARPRRAATGSRSPSRSRCCRARGPADLVEVTLALAARDAARSPGVDADPAAALADGSALDVSRDGRARRAATPTRRCRGRPRARSARARAGCVTRLDALAVGVAAWRLGAGRARKEDPVSPVAGVVCVAKQGDPVEEGQPILDLHVDDPSKVTEALEALDGGIVIGSEASRAQARRARRHPLLIRHGDAADARGREGRAEGRAARSSRRRAASADDHRARGCGGLRGSAFDRRARARRVVDAWRGHPRHPPVPRNVRRTPWP